MKPDPGAPTPAGRVPAARPIPDSHAPRPRGPRQAARAVLTIAELALATLLYLAAASLLALLIVRVGADWIDGTGPFAGSGEQPRLYPRQLAMRELALDIVRQCLLAGLVLGLARWRGGSGWRNTLALGRASGEPSRLRPAVFGSVLLAWPLVHIVWVTGSAELFRAPFGRHVALSQSLSATAAAIWLAYVVVLAPLAEELLMRGAIFAKGLGPLGPAGIIATTTVLFAGAHLTAAGLARPVSLLPLALMLGWLRWRSGRLWPCIVLHGWSNLAMLAYVLWPAGA